MLVYIVNPDRDVVLDCSMLKVGLEMLCWTLFLHAKGRTLVTVMLQSCKNRYLSKS